MDNNNHKSANKSITLPKLIKNDDVNGVRNYLDKNGLPKYSDWDDYNLLIYLLGQRQKEMAKLFIDTGCRLNRFSVYWNTSSPLHIAVEMGDSDIVQMLLSKGASLSAKNMNDETPLILAAMINNNDITDMILSMMVSYENHLNWEYFSHMHIACIRNRTDIVKKFLQNGVKINDAVNSYSLHWPGYTPLHFAVHFKCIETVKFLVSNGADITAKTDKDSITPLHLAFRMRNELMIDTILSAHYYHAKNPANSEGLSHFHIACTRNNLEVVKHFIHHGVDVGYEMPHDTSKWESFTAVSFATEFGCTNVAKFLITHNEKLLIINHNNVHRHISHAYFKGNKTIMNLLLSMQLGKDINDVRNKYSLSYRFFYKKDKSITTNEVIPYENSVDNIMDRESVRSAQYTKLHSAIEHKQRRTLVKWMQTTNLYYSDCESSKTDNGYDIDTDIYNIDSNTDTDSDIDNDIDLIRTKDTRGKTVLHLAFENNKPIFITKIFSLPKAVEENLVDNTGLSYFHISCTTSNLKIIKKFLLNGVDINSSVKSDAVFWPGFTPLHFAVQFHLSLVVRLLLIHGADISAKNGLGLTPFDLAVQCVARACRKNCSGDVIKQYEPYFTIVELILSSSESRECAAFEDRGLSLLHIASAKNDLAAIRYVVTSENINKACDANSPIWQGCTPLHVAAHFGCSEAVKLLIDRGADVSIEDAEGNLPAHLSISRRKKGLDSSGFWADKYDLDSRLLLTERNSSGGQCTRLSIFQMACTLNNTQAVRHFLELGVDVDEPYSFESSDEFSVGRTPLILALESKAYDVARLLVSSGADVRAWDGYLHTALHNCHDADLVDELVKRGADINALDFYGQTPACAVFQRQRPTEELALAFLRNGADVNLASRNGTTPFVVVIPGASDMERAFSPEELQGSLQMVLHIKSIEVLGVPMHPVNQECYQGLERERSLFSNFRDGPIVERCMMESERLKSTKINRTTTLHDFIFLKDPSKLSRYCEIPGLREMVETAKFNTDFPIYGYLVKLQLNRGSMRKSLVEQSEASLGLLSGRWLDSLCCEMICEFLMEDDLRSLINVTK